MAQKDRFFTCFELQHRIPYQIAKSECSTEHHTISLAQERVLRGGVTRDTRTVIELIERLGHASHTDTVFERRGKGQGGRTYRSRDSSSPAGCGPNSSPRSLGPALPAICSKREGMQAARHDDDGLVLVRSDVYGHSGGMQTLSGRSAGSCRPS